MFTINSTSLPVPSSFSVGTFIVTGDDTKRDTAAYMLASKIATKQVLEIEYNFISSSNLAIIQSLLDGTSFFLSVTYKDPRTGATVSKQMYPGDVNVAVIDEIGGVTRYKDFKFSLRER